MSPAVATDAPVWRASALDALAAKAAYKALVLADSPVAYLRLAETAGLVAVELVAARNGTIGATGITYAQPSALAGDPADRAMAFATSGKIDLQYDAALNPAVFSIEAWFNGGPQGNDPVWECRPASSGPTAAGFDLFIGISGANPTAGFAICSANVAQDIRSFAMTPNVWHHMVGTYDGAQSRLYVDGVLRSGPTTCSFTPNPSRTVGIGHINAGGNFLTGQLDEIALYGYALSPTQIANHYLAGTTPLGALATARDALV